MWGNWHRALHLLEEILAALLRIEYRLTHPFRTAGIQVRFGGTMANTVTEIVGQSVTAAVVPLEADGTTTTPNAAVSAQQWSVPDATVVALTTNPDGSATFKAVAAGTVTVSVTATVTDQDGTVATFSTTGTITVTAPTGRTASITIDFGKPA